MKHDVGIKNEIFNAKHVEKIEYLLFTCPVAF